MNILAIDIGTNTGWAIGRGGKLIDAGTWKLATAKEIALAGKNRMNRRLDPRIPALWHKLRNAHIKHAFDWVVFEDVTFSSAGTYQTQLWSSLRAVIWLFADDMRIQIECLGVSKLKQFATGHGGATKDMMAASLVRSDSRFLLEKGLVKDTVSGMFLTDDAVDAIHLLNWAIKTLKHA